jgi:hypothetical protein
VPNFLINTLDERIDIELGENGDIDSEDISSMNSHSHSVSASNPRFSVSIVITPFLSPREHAERIFPGVLAVFIRQEAHLAVRVVATSSPASDSSHSGTGTR